MNIFTPWWFGCHINQKLANISSRGQVVKILGLVGSVVSPATTQLFSCSEKAARDNT